MVDLESRGSQVEKEKHTGAPAYRSVARFNGVVPLLLLLRRCCTARALVKFRGSVGWKFPSLLCSGWYTHIIRTHTEAHVRSCHKTKALT